MGCASAIDSIFYSQIDLGFFLILLNSMQIHSLCRNPTLGKM